MSNAQTCTSPSQNNQTSKHEKRNLTESTMASHQQAKRKLAATTASTKSVISRVERILGITEAELVRLGPVERQRYILRKKEDGTMHFCNSKTQALTPIGSFSTPTVSELQTKVLNQRSEEFDLQSKKMDCEFHCLYHVDIGELQTRLKTDDKCLVQIAGNFNCLNVSNRRVAPDNGRIVEMAHQQKTQGPAATFGPIASHLYRVHFCMPPEYSGQTLTHQIDLLDKVTAHTGQTINGKLTLQGDERPIHNVDEVAQSIRVGLQTDCHVLYGRNKEKKPVCLIDDIPPVIDQCHGAAVNWNSLTVDHTRNHTPPWISTKQQDIMVLARTTLRAAYEGVYLAAIVRRRKHLYATLIGGGVFGNPNHLIVEELARAHTKWANHPASCLEKVYLCAYSPADNVEALLEARGIEITRKKTEETDVNHMNDPH